MNHTDAGIAELLQTLDLAELRRISDARAKKWNGGSPAPLSFAMMELAGEVGEACNAAKKYERHLMGWVGGSPDLSNLADELADTVICADLAAMRVGIDLGAAVIAKFNKTSEKHGFAERLGRDSARSALVAELHRAAVELAEEETFIRNHGECHGPEYLGSLHDNYRNAKSALAAFDAKEKQA